MDLTAPNNNQPNSGSATPPNPIQPGQFVVAGDDSQAQQAPTSAPAPIAPQPPQTPTPPAVSLAGQRQESAIPLVPPSASQAGASAQPDPTPFTAPNVGQQSAPENAKASGGSKSKGILLVVAFIALLAIIGAVVYFFVLPKLKGNSAKTQTSTDVQIEEPSPPPPKTGSGFGDIPQSTESAQPAPAVPGAPTTPTTPATTNNSPVSP